MLKSGEKTRAGKHNLVVRGVKELKDLEILL